MQLLPGCDLVASGYLGFNLTSHWDAHAYVVRSGREAILIDTGCGRETEAVAERVEAALRGSALVAILLTHAHVDHSGGAAALADRFGVQVHAHAAACAPLAAGDEEAVGLRAARDAGVYPADQHLRPVRAVAIGPDPLPFGELMVRALPTPGHSADHLSYAVDLPTGRAVFTGDLVFAQGRIAMLDSPDTDARRLRTSLHAVLDLHPEHLFPGHGAVSLQRGWAHVQAAVDSYAQGHDPAGLLR